MNTRSEPSTNIMNCVYFKLFGNIKSPHEANELARLELEGLAGNVEPVKNFSIELTKAPLREFTNMLFDNSDVLVADALTHETAYGKVKGYRLKLPRICDISSWVMRLGYTREIFVFIEEGDKRTLKRLFPKARLGVNAAYVQGKKGCLFRFITHQYFLENSRYISKLSRNEDEVDRNLTRLYESLTKRFYRIPASATLKIGKRLEDYFAIREEPSLYLTHYMHPYKGKFHPKMARALLNYVNPEHDGVVMDNFAGSGTLLVEASLLGLDSTGVEINPLSVLMCNVKCASLKKLDPIILKRSNNLFMSRLKKMKREPTHSISLEKYLDANAKGKIGSEWQRIMRELRKWDKNEFGVADYLSDAIAAVQLAKRKRNAGMREFYLLAISGAISEKSRRRQTSFRKILEDRLEHLYLRIYLFKELNKMLRIRVGNGRCYEADTRNLGEIPLKDIDGNVNSPPYSTALNYILNDQPQLTILGLHPDLEKLRESMIGFPGVNFDKKVLMEEIESSSASFASLPSYAQDIIRRLISGDRRDAALRIYKFVLDTRAAIDEISKVLKKGAKYVTIIGNNNYKLNGRNGDEDPSEDSANFEMGEFEFDNKGYLNLDAAANGYIEVKNDRIVAELGKQFGFKLDHVVARLLAKSSAGFIRYESIVILEKT